MTKERTFRRGQSFLALVFLIGAIIAVVGLLIAFFANAFVDTGYGLSASVAAEAAANSGVEDAMIRLDRNPALSYPYPSSPYSLPVGSTTATVYITQNSPSGGYITVLSAATVSNRTRKVSAVFLANASTSQVSIISWQDIQ